MSWVDQLVTLGVVLAGGLIVADVLLGPEKRKALKERVGDWWLHLSYTSYAGLVAEDARNVLRGIHGVLGPRWLSTRFFIACTSYGMAIAFFSYMIAGSFFSITHPGTNTECDFNSLFYKDLANLHAIEEMTGEHLTFCSKGLRPQLVLFLPALWLLNGLFDWISIAITMRLLAITSEEKDLKILAVLILADVAISATLIIVSLTVASVFTAVILEPFSHLEIGGETFWRYANAILTPGSETDDAILLATSTGMLVVSIVPSLCHLIFSALIIICKIFLPVLKPFVGLILLRLHESQQGVLSAIGAAIGFLAGILKACKEYLT